MARPHLAVTADSNDFDRAAADGATPDQLFECPIDGGVIEYAQD
jgi:hypothetical protein